jgi:acylglycerol lipase
MKKPSLHFFTNGINTTTMVASSSSASNAVMRGLGGIVRTKAPVAPFVSDIIQIGAVDCCLHTWDTDGRPPKALVVFLHGANTHGSFPTTRLVANFMVASGYSFMAPDFPGHGRSSGLRGHIESSKNLINFAVGIVEHAYRVYLEKAASKKANNHHTTSGMKLFLMGSSMGGNLALQVSLRRKDLVSGVILLAPMLRISRVTPFTRFFLLNAGEMVPMAEIIPVGRNNNYRCPKIREECENDKLKPYQEGDMVRLGTVKSLVELTDSLESQFDRVSCPCLVMVADEDKTVNNQGAVDLCERAQSKDMTLKRYPALHGLMGEPSPLVDRMQDDILSWLDSRCSRVYLIQSSL